MKKEDEADVQGQAFAKKTGWMKNENRKKR